MRPLSTRGTTDGLRRKPGSRPALASLVFLSLFWPASLSLHAQNLQVAASLEADGTLRILGTPDADRITLRTLGRRSLEVDDETLGGPLAEFRFDLDDLTRIVVSGDAGDDRLVLLDPTQAVLASGKPLDIDGGEGDDRIDLTGFGLLASLASARLAESPAGAALATPDLDVLFQAAQDLRTRAYEELLEPQGAFLAQLHLDVIRPAEELAPLGDSLLAQALRSWANLARIWADPAMNTLLPEVAPSSVHATPNHEAQLFSHRMSSLLARLDANTATLGDPGGFERHQVLVTEIEAEMQQLENSLAGSPGTGLLTFRRARSLGQQSAELTQLAGQPGDSAERELSRAAQDFERRVQEELLGGAGRIESAARDRFLASADSIEAEVDRLLELVSRLGPTLLGRLPPGLDAPGRLEGPEPAQVELFDEASFDCPVTSVSTITGGSGDDWLFGSPFSDSLFGGDGRDRIFGFGSADLIRGGEEHDELFGGGGRDEIHGDEGADLLLGNAHGDCLWGEDGNDLILGDAFAFGDPGADAADGGAGFDLIFGFADNDVLVGGPGADLVFGMKGADRIHGDDVNPDLCDSDETDSQAGIDLLFGNRGPDLMYGGDGLEIEIEIREDVTVPLHLGNLMFGNRGEDQMFGGHGIDVMFGNRQDDTINGCQNIDVLFGNQGADVVDGREGGVAFTIDGVPIRLGNLMFGNQGNDVVRGGPDLDVAFGNRGDDQIFGGDGSFLILGLDTDILFGNQGNDTLDGGLGRDWVFGNTGDDVVRGDDGSPLLIGRSADWLFGNQGEDLLDGGSAEDILFGNRDDDRLIGGRGTDLLFGNQGCDDLRGGNALDILFGNRDHDILSGDAGPDLLFGNRGQDTLSGGTSFDFLFGNQDADALAGGDGPDLVVGNRGDDSLRGGSGFLNILIGNRGEDHLFATGGSINILSGDRGNDCLQGGSSLDVILGGAGRDCLAGAGSKDVMFGGSGPDTLFGDGGWDKMWGDAPIGLFPFGLLGPPTVINPFRLLALQTLLRCLIDQDCDDALVGGSGWDLIRGGPGVDVAWASKLEFPRVEARVDGPEPPRCQCVFADVRPGCIRGRKFHDIDADGVQGPREPGLGGWTITATGEDGTVASDVTAADGSYSICCLPADRYQVGEELQPGWLPTEPPAGSQDVELSPGQDLTGIDFGNVRPAPTCPGLPASARPGCIEGSKFMDTNGDLTLDPFEPLLDGWTITVQGIGAPVTTVTAGGRYSVCCLRPGTYQVTETPQAGWEPEHPPSGTHTVELGPDEILTGIDFANRQSRDPLTVTPEIAQRFGCDRLGSYTDAVTLHIEGGVGPFRCDGPGTFEQTDPRTCVFTVAAGDHTFTIEDLGTDPPETNRLTIPVTLPEIIEVSPLQITHPTLPTCRNGVISLEASGGAPPYTNRIMGPGLDKGLGGPVLTAVGLEPGDYTVSFTDSKGCRNCRKVTLSCRPMVLVDDSPIAFSVHYRTDHVDELGTGSLDRFTFDDLNGDGRFDPGEPVLSGGLEGVEARVADVELQLVSARVAWKPGGFAASRLTARPSLTAEIGEAGLDLNVLDTGRPGESWKGSGLAWGVGAAVDLQTCLSCPWKVGGAYRYFRANGIGIDLVATPAPAPIGRLIITTGEIDFERQWAEATVEYTGRGGRSTFELGLRRSWYDVGLTARSSHVGIVSLDESDHEEILDALLVRVRSPLGHRWSLGGESSLASSGWTASVSLDFSFGGSEPEQSVTVPPPRDPIPEVQPCFTQSGN